MENKDSMPLTYFQNQVKDMTPEEKRAMHEKLTQIIEKKRAAASKKQSLIVSINLDVS